MEQTDTSKEPGRLRQFGRFILQTTRWAVLLGFASLIGLSGKIWLRLTAAPGDVTATFTHWRLNLAGGGGSTSIKIIPFAAFALIMVALFAGLSWILRKVPRREFYIQNGIIAGVIALSFGLVFGLRQEASKQVGQPMPALDVEYLTARPELHEKVVLVEFWATWCGPCIANIPHLNELQEKFRDRGLVVVGISSERQRGVVEAFWRKGEMHYPVAIQPGGALQSRLGVRGIPHSFLVNRSGRIIWQGHPASLSADRIEAALR